MNCILNNPKCYTECSQWQECYNWEKKDEVRTHWLPSALLLLVTAIMIYYAITQIMN
jgi:hypothetical protein